MGMDPPDRISPVTINIVMIPLSSIVKIVMICIKSEIEVTMILDSIIVIRNNRKAFILIGVYNLYGSGNKRAIAVTGRNLSSTAANLDPYIVANHFL